MLNENIRRIRQAKGLSQEELALKLNVVRQTVSKWEQGRSVPDADLLIALSRELETPVSALLGETVPETAPDALTRMAEKLEVLNLRLVRQDLARWRALSRLMLVGSAASAAVLIVLAALKSPYLHWDYRDLETAVAGTLLHAFEYLYVRLAPAALAAMLAVGLFAQKKAARIGRLHDTHDIKEDR